MHKTIPARSLLAGLTLATAIGLAPAGAAAKPPSGAGQPDNAALARDIREVNDALTSAVTTIDKTSKSLAASVHALQTGLAATNANLAQTNSNVSSTQGQVTSLSSALAAGSATVTAALQQINTALSDPNTGLAALNNARPRFVALTVSSGQFALVAGGQTPEHAITIVAQPGAGEAILDFGEDVSQRALVVSPAPDLMGVPVGQAVDCANAPGACGPDSSPNHVLLTTEQITSGPAATAVPVTLIAFSG